MFVILQEPTETVQENVKVFLDTVSKVKSLICHLWPPTAMLALPDTPVRAASALNRTHGFHCHDAISIKDSQTILVGAWTTAL